MRLRAWLCTIGGALLVTSPSGEAQRLTYNSGQPIAPAYEGWEQNEDGSHNLLFGYMNQNWEEEPDIPVGPDNYFEPGPADRGQPTHFLPRRNRFVFKVRVPADFEDQELVWNLTVNGQTIRAYGSLMRDYVLEPITIISEKGGIRGGGATTGVRENTPPTVRVEGPLERTVKAGEPLRLIVQAIDDGLPPPRRLNTPRPAYRRPPQRSTVSSATGLRVSWFVYRGEGRVTFDPPQINVWEDTRAGANSPWAANWVAPPLPPDGRIMVHATFDRPGTYVLRCLADDGGLWDDEDVTVIVASELNGHD